MSAYEYVLLRSEDNGHKIAFTQTGGFRFRVTRPELVVSGDIYNSAAEAESAGAEWLLEHGYTDARPIYPNGWRKPRASSGELAEALRVLLCHITCETGATGGIGRVSLEDTGALRLSIYRAREALKDFDSF